MNPLLRSCTCQIEVISIGLRRHPKSVEILLLYLGDIFRLETCSISLICNACLVEEVEEEDEDAEEEEAGVRVWLTGGGQEEIETRIHARTEINERGKKIKQ